MADDNLCQCPKCGRMHRKLANNPPALIARELSHSDLSRLSRAFNQAANLSINSPDYRINEWLKEKIKQLSPSPAPEHDD
jgi:hypothetical protein